MNLLLPFLFIALLFNVSPAFSQSNCYDIGSSSYCNSVTEDGQLSVIECYWMNDNKFCRINNEDYRRVY